MTAWLLISIGSYSYAETKEKKTKPAHAHSKANLVLSLINGAAAGIATGYVGYQATHSILPTIAAGAAGAAYNGGWQYSIEPLMRWFGRPFSWDKYGFLTRNIKLGSATAGCVAAVGCVLEVAGVSNSVDTWEFARRVFLETGRYLLVGLPAYETIHYFMKPKPGPARRFLLNLAPFTVEVGMTTAMALGFAGYHKVSDGTFYALLGGATLAWVGTRFTQWVNGVKHGSLVAARSCASAYRSMSTGRRPPPPPPAR